MRFAAEPRRTDDDPLRGTPYRALGVLGEGAMGVVWSAVDNDTGQGVAIKVMRAELATDAEHLERFRTEAEIAALLDHPNVVRVIELRMPPAVSFPYYVMESMAGETLLQRLKRNGALPVDDAIDLTLQMLQGLASVHAAGVVHRDIKPGNLFLCRKDDATLVKLLDFGIAKLLPPDERSPQLTPHTFQTREGTFLGTALYASPEQATGEPVDRRTDVFAAGTVLYNMLTGRTPFGRVRETRDVLRLQRTKTPEPPSKLALSPIPPELDELVMASLAKRAEDRFASAEAFAEALEDVADRLEKPAGWLRTHHFDPRQAEALQQEQPPEPTRTRRKSKTQNARRRPRRPHRDLRPLVLVATAVAAGCVVALVMLYAAGFR